RMRDSSTPLFSATLTPSRTTSTTASGGKDETLSSAESIAYFRPSVDSRCFTSTTSPDSGSVTETPVTDSTQLTTPSRTAMIQNSQKGGGNRLPIRSMKPIARYSRGSFTVESGSVMGGEVIGLL